ncbi:fimbria/pilus outer membrane usher protein [unidentified bacterial endosymbiont]|uniref:fimbria/pilus outer membrane usher protein n=1 Tax=unidentified bacterial endosymbiont TaxID=2355 RepID=UPI0020A14A31|nr:fimbria/pilus outer membrane usher protein [unidentified bacterial endosymbiont]
MTNGLCRLLCKRNNTFASRVRGFSGILLFTSMPLFAREYLFSPSSLEGGVLTQQDIDLSLFSKPNAQPPGRYSSHIVINKRRKGDADVNYVSSPTGELVAEITPDMLRQWGVDVDKFPALANFGAQTPLDKPLRDYIPFASATLDFSKMTLRLSIPQAGLASNAEDYVDPTRWNDGVPVMFTDYAFSGSRHSDDAQNTLTSQYLNLRSGANLGGWRLRNYSTWNKTEDATRWSTINTFIQHDIDVLKAQFTAGENSTRGEVFDSLQYRGVNMASDEEMLPYSQRGFAPVIRGIASSNAEISVRQNGYLIYQQSVAPGAFEIRDLYSTTNSGDLEVTVKEADGSERHFTQPYSSIAVMQRPGHLKYEVTAARYRADSGSDQKEPAFVQASAIYGLNNTMTLFGGLTASEDYQAINSGAGVTLGVLGSLSADVTVAKTRLDNDEQHTGQSYRLLYTGKIDASETNFTLGSYRYSTDGYFSFADANQKYDGNENDWLYQYNKRSRIQASISQSILGSSFYLNGYQQDYWGSARKERNLSAGINTVVEGISLHMAYTYSKTSDDGSDRMISFGISMPLSKWLPGAWSSYTLSNSKNGYTRQNLGINGTLLDDERLSYSLQQSHTNHDADDTSSLYGSYRSQYANLNAGYYTSSDNTQQISYGASGAIVAHPHGITLAQPLGDQFAIVSADGAAGVRFKNQRGVQTDWQGNAVIPSLTPYQENRIRIDTTSLPQDVDTRDTSITVVPSRNAAVAARFDAHVGYRALIVLTRPDGRNVPFGAIATVRTSGINGIVDDTGTLYLAGINDNAQLDVMWGNAVTQRCTAHLMLTDLQHSDSPTGIRQAHVICQQEQQNVK